MNLEIPLPKVRREKRKWHDKESEDKTKVKVVSSNSSVPLFGNMMGAGLSRFSENSLYESF
jgi:hypothetical protein